MNRLWIAGLAIAAGAAIAAAAGAAETPQRVQGRTLAEAVKPGQWEFTSQLQMPGTPQMPAGARLPSGTTMQPGAGMKSTYRTCVDSEKAVPSDPRGQCKIGNVDRKGATVSWTGTCATGQGTVRSEGVARYSGNTMEANLTTHVPGAGGQTMKTTQHITGHYVGPCTR
jgi:hypothetical protein